MPATIFAGSKVKTLKDTLSLNGGADIISSTVDPTAVATDGAPGSLLLNTTSGKLYRKNDSGSSTNWEIVGSGAGGINYVTNPDAESSTTGWSTYADAAGAAPVDGSGGTANITWTRSTSSPLRGVADFVLTKDAVNRQGQGVATDIEIDLADQAKVLQIAFNYEVLSGTYATGDIGVYMIADPAGTPVVIQPAGYQVVALGSGTKGQLIATFQTQASGQAYRLCLHVASTSAAAYSLAVDTVQVGPQNVTYSAPVTDWQSYTPTITVASGTVPTFSSVTGRWRRVGDSIEADVSAVWQTATTFSGGLYASLPAGLSIDLNKTANSGTAHAIGFGYIRDAGVGNFPAIIRNLTASTTTVEIQAILTDTTSTSISDPAYVNPVTSTIPFTFGATDEIRFRFSAPISGWSSSVQMASESSEGRVVAFSQRNGSTTTFTNETKVLPFGTVDVDTHSGRSSNTYVVKVPGLYRVAAKSTTSFSLANAASTHQLLVFNNGTELSGGDLVNADGSNSAGLKSVSLNVNYIYLFKAGDIIDFRFRTDYTGVATTELKFVSIERLSGNTAIAASETVAMVVHGTSGSQAINTTATKIVFTTVESDTHGAYSASTGIYKVPVSGYYSVSWLVATNNVTLSTTERFVSVLRKGGTVIKNGMRSVGSGANTSYASAGSVQGVWLIAGEELDIAAASSVATTAVSANEAVFFTVVRN